MPQYYGNYDPTTAFSSGLMAGFEFVDRIKARNRELQMQNEELQMRRDNQAFNQHMALNADSRANAQEQRSADEYQHTASRRPVLEGREDEQYSHNLSRRPVLESQSDNQAAASLDATRTNTAATKDALQERRNLRSSRYDVAKLFVGPGEEEQPTAQQGSRPSLSDVGNNIPPAATGSPADAQPAAPADLRAAQQTIDQQNADRPSFISRVMTLGHERSQENEAKLHANATKEYWNSIANPGKEASGRALQSAAVRRDPLSEIDSYMSQRDQIDPKDRDVLDVTMRNALSDKAKDLRTQIAALDPSDNKNATKIKQLNNELGDLGSKTDQMARAAIISAPKNAGITQSVKPSDPKVLDAVKNAAGAYSDAPPVTSADELRSMNTQLSRMSNAKRLTPKQVETLARAYAHGAIDEQTLANWRTYGGPLAPQQPKVTSLGGGVGVAMYPNGAMAIIDGGKNKEAATKTSQHLTYAASLANSMIKNGQIKAEEGGGAAVVNDALTLIQANPDAYEKATGIRVRDQGGNIDLNSVLAPQNVRTALDFRSKVVTKNRDPRESALPIKNSERAGESVPQVSPLTPGPDGVIDMTGYFR